MTQVWRGNVPLERCPVCSRRMYVGPEIIVRDGDELATWEQWCLEGCAVNYVYAPPAVAKWLARQREGD